MNTNYIWLTTILILIVTTMHVAEADYINFTGAELSPCVAEFYIEDDRVVLFLEIGERDKEAFSDLIKSPGDGNQLNKFFKEGLVILADGKPLQGTVRLSEVRERVQRPSIYQKPPGAKKPSPYVHYVEIEYPFSGKPGTIEFIPPLDDQSYPEASIGYVVYHKSIPIIDFRFLVPGPKLKLDWNDPWYSKYDHPNLKRHHSSSLMSFLYIEPFEVRHEILVRLKDMEDWVELGYENEDILGGAEQKMDIEGKLADYFLSHNILEVDGIKVKPILDRVKFIRTNLTGIQYLDDSEEIEYLSAIVGIILAYSVKGMPKKVTVDWDMFSDNIKSVPARMVDPAGPFPYLLTPEENILTWNNYLKNFNMPEISELYVSDTTRNVQLPLGSALSFFILIGAAWQIWGRGRGGKVSYILLAVSIAAGIMLFPYFRVSLHEHIPASIVLSKEQSSFIVQNLLKNVYRSFDFKNEQDVYDKLALSAHGDLLTEIYLEARKSMEIENQGGARARVEEVEIVDISSDPIPNSRGLKFRSTWNVSGSVEHWGHKHKRKNQYQADIIIKPIEGKWKITGINLIEEKRVQPI